MIFPLSFAVGASIPSSARTFLDRLSDLVLGHICRSELLIYSQSLLCLFDDISAVCRSCLDGLLDLLDLFLYPIAFSSSSVSGASRLSICAFFNRREKHGKGILSLFIFCFHRLDHSCSYNIDLTHLIFLLSMRYSQSIQLVPHVPVMIYFVNLISSFRTH